MLHKLFHAVTTDGIQLTIGRDGTLLVYGDHPMRANVARKVIDGSKKVGTVRSVLGAYAAREGGKAREMRPSARFFTLRDALLRDPRVKQSVEQQRKGAVSGEAMYAAVCARYGIQQ